MKLAEIKTEGHFKLLLLSEPGVGKCLAEGTEVLKYDGTVATVESLNIGDLLMGPDSQPRKITALGNGTAEMWQVNPVKGEPWQCNDVHMLTLWSKNKKELIDIELNKFVENYTQESVNFCLVRTGVNFPFREWESKLTPYELGIWIGDGHYRTPSITKNDIEVLNAWKDVASRFEVDFKITLDPRTGCSSAHARPNGSGGKTKNPVQHELEKFKLNGMKNLPHWALTASYENRMSLLAGLLDTDGSLSQKTFEFSTKHLHICNQFLFLSRSLGFAAYSTPKIVNGVTYWRVSLSGNTHLIPTRIPRKQAGKREQMKDVLHTGFSLESVGLGDYYGFTLDGDGRFLLADFTITHNTVFAAGLPYPTLYLDFDHKVDSAALFYKNDKERLAGIDVRQLAPSLNTTAIDQLNEIVSKELIPAQSAAVFPWKTIVLDSITTFSAQVLGHIVKSNPGIKRTESRQGAQPGLQDYGILKREFQKLIPGILSLPCNVIMLAHVATEKDDLTGQIMRFANMDGSFAKELPVYFKEVWRAFADDKGQRWAQTQSDAKFSLRSQIPGLPNPVKLSYAEIEKYLK